MFLINNYAQCHCKTTNQSPFNFSAGDLQMNANLCTLLNCPHPAVPIEKMANIYFRDNSNQRDRATIMMIDVLYNVYKQGCAWKKLNNDKLIYCYYLYHFSWLFSPPSQSETISHVGLSRLCQFRDAAAKVNWNHPIWQPVNCIKHINDESDMRNADGGLFT